MRLGEERKKERKKKRQDENIYSLPYYTGRPQTMYRIALTPRRTNHFESVVTYLQFPTEVCLLPCILNLH